MALLERHGVLTREAVAAEEVAGGFSALYPVLRAMEESGRIRRGYFVDGLGAAQFALPGAVDRLRSMRGSPDDRSSGAGPVVHLMAAADPGNAYGAALAWPRRGDADRQPLSRAAGAYVVLVDGAAVLYMDRGGHSLRSLPAADDGETAGLAMAALRELVDGGRFRELVVTRVDGEPVASSPWRPMLEEAGFVAGYRGFVLRPSGRSVVVAGRGLPPETAAADNYWRRQSGTSGSGRRG
jgi:ATP-dependent Lhr-like helicase